MYKIPERIALANLPTKVEKLEKLSKELGVNIFLKRDDGTGIEASGNKIRKLEYAIKEALNQGCEMLITCGGSQSNHCRAVAQCAARLGLKSTLVLRGEDTGVYEGNLLLDKLFNANIKFITAEEYRDSRGDIMNNLKANYEAEGIKSYILPEGASNGIGLFGYYHGMEEILEDELNLGIKFDTIGVTVGSSGTYAGLVLGNKVLNDSKAIIAGINICDTADFFKEKTLEIIEESKGYCDFKSDITLDDLTIIDGYVGEGYGLPMEEQIEFIKEIAALEGVILDPVYTGKAFYGLVNEIKKGRFKDAKNILFIHTGGLYGLFPQGSKFKF